MDGWDQREPSTGYAHSCSRRYGLEGCPLLEHALDSRPLQAEA